MNIFSLSFGKDSMANLLFAIEHGVKIDKVMYCDIRFSRTISGEHPVMADWILKADNILYERYGLNVDFAFSLSYLDQFFKVKQRGNHVGDFYGFPHLCGAWCNSRLKLNAISKYLSQFKGHDIVQFVGLAVDEPIRYNRLISKNSSNSSYRSLLFENNLTEQDCFSICEKHGLLSPIYNLDDGIFRGGCWFCPKQCKADLYHLWKYYPDYFNYLIYLEQFSPCSFRPDGNPSDFAHLFSCGYVPCRKKVRSKYTQLSIFDFIGD